MAFVGGDFVFGHLEQLPSIATLAWTPWIVATALEALKPAGRTFPFAACLAGAALAGHPHYLVLTILFLPVPLAGALASAPKPAGWRLTRLAAGAGLATGMAAVQLLPTQELGALSERVWPWPDPHEPALRWTHLPAVAVPRYFNRLAGASGRPLGFTELGIYAGLLTLPLALGGVAAALRAPRREPLASAMVALWLLAVLFALGRQGGLAEVAVRAVPFLAKSRGSARALGLATMAYALLAGRGLEGLRAWLGQGAALRPWTLARWAPTAAVAALAVDLSWTHAPELRRRLVDADARLTSEPWTPIITFPTPGPKGPGRVYRFMLHDGDYYLDDRPSAVVHRRKRLMPGLSGMDGRPIALLDGYEQGLLRRGPRPTSCGASTATCARTSQTRPCWPSWDARPC